MRERIGRWIWRLLTVGRYDAGLPIDGDEFEAEAEVMRRERSVAEHKLRSYIDSERRARGG